MAPTQSKPPGALTRQATSGGFMLQRQPTHAQLLASSVQMDDTDREIGANLWKQQRMLPPSSRIKHLWDYAMTVLVLYNFVLTPVQLGYYTARTLTESFGGLTALDGVIYLAFVLDLAINFRTTYYDDERQIVLDARLVAQRYLNTWFWWDFFGTLPLHLIGAAATLGTPQRRGNEVLSYLSVAMASEPPLPPSEQPLLRTVRMPADADAGTEHAAPPHRLL